jgi:hypothetical protein
MNQPDMSAVRTTSRLLAALLGAALVIGVAAPLAGAQDPYGSTTTTAPPVRQIEATCGLSIGSGRPGDSVTATVRGVFLGENVRIFFDGVQVASGTAPTTASAATGGGGLARTDRRVVALSSADVAVFNAPAQVTTTSVTLTFTVPNAAPGTHIVTAVGDTFSCFCNPNGEFQVLASKSPRSLPRTGVYVALYLVLAAILLGIGSELVLRARRRRARLLAASTPEDEDYYTSAR